MTLLNSEEKKPEVQALTENNLSQQNFNSNSANEKVENVEDKKEDGDPNWRAFREARKKDRLEREFAEKRAAEKEKEIQALKAAMEAAFSKNSAPTPQAYQQYYGMNQGYDQHQEETEEQKIERKLNELLSKREQQARKEQEEYERREYPNRLNRDFPDFSNVCSQENLDYLDYHYPEVSRPLQRLNEGYDKWHDIYHAVKKFLPNHENAKKDSMKAEVNTNKPRSMSTPSSSYKGEPVRESWQESERKRSENWARMQRLMKGV